MHIKAPWTPEQVEQLNKWQEAGYVHPFTCGNDDCTRSNGKELVATIDGWTCPSCSYKQDWAHDFMADPEMLEKASPQNFLNGR